MLHSCESTRSRRRRDDGQELSDLIGSVYDAALDGTLWRPALARAAAFIGGPSAALFSKGAAGAGEVYHIHGDDPHYTALYFQRFVRLDPATTGHFFAEVEEPVSTGDLMPYDEFLQTDFYKEWVRPQGYVDFIAAALDKSPETTAMFGVFRHERDGLADAGARRRMRLVVPHIRRAVLVSRAIDLKAAEAATFADTLDRISAGVCFVAADGRIIHANEPGAALLGAGEGLATVGGRLVARDAAVDRALRAAFAAAEQGDLALGGQGVALAQVSPDGSRRLLLHVLPLTRGTRRVAGVPYAAVAAVFIRRVGLELPAPQEVIARTFGLTPTELRVLLAVVEVGGVPDVAVTLGIAETTVKTHLARLFSKTGTGRQAELVKLVAGFMSPLQP
jgi:DNA-binding CsgD family transcriptional regulator/PAS domain-containing protein